MAPFARQIVVAVSIAGLISVASASAMAQSSAGSLSSAFGSSPDYRPDWPDFAPFRAPAPSPSGEAKLIEVPGTTEVQGSPLRRIEPNVLILPRVVHP